MLGSSVADSDPGLFYPLDPRSGYGMNFFRIFMTTGMTKTKTLLLKV
jgi:hypothetical protein